MASCRSEGFVSGDNVVDPRFQEVDAGEGTVNHLVFACDINSVGIDPQSDIVAFVPVELTGFELIEVTGQGGDITGSTFEPRLRTPPGALVLQVDDVDEFGNVTVQRNIGTRDRPAPVTNVVCGSVVVIVVEGVLTVPFLSEVSNEPSYDLEDDDTIAAIGGRYTFGVFVQ